MSTTTLKLGHPMKSLGRGLRNPRTWAAGGLALALALLVPVKSYAFVNQIGGNELSFPGAAISSTLVTTQFTAPTTVRCMVTVDLQADTQHVTFNPAGKQFMWPLARIAGVDNFFGTGTINAASKLNGYFHAHDTKLFTINQGQTARFGCHIEAEADFSNAGVNNNCNVTYVCM